MILPSKKNKKTVGGQYGWGKGPQPGNPSNDFRTATNREDHAMDATTQPGRPLDQPPNDHVRSYKKSVRCNIFCNQSLMSTDFNRKT